jgi:hypothetical protein
LLPILRRVIRLLISILCAVGLALTPVTVSATAAPSSDMAACTMNGQMPAKPADHSKMECCTPACQASSSAALLPSREAGSGAHATATMNVFLSVKELAGVTSSGLDPPPRA